MTREETTKLARESQNPKVLDRLSKHEGWWVRRSVARNPNTPLDILDRLSRDEDLNVRRGVDENPKWKTLQEPGLLDVAKLASKWLGIF